MQLTPEQRAAVIAEVRSKSAAFHDARKHILFAYAWQLAEETVPLAVRLADECERLSLMPADDGLEPADSNWAESVNFRWSSDGTAMVLNDCGWEILLTGDVADCEKERGLSLMSPKSIVTGTPVQCARLLIDNPTRSDVRYLCKALGIPLAPIHGEGGGT